MNKLDQVRKKRQEKLNKAQSDPLEAISDEVKNDLVEVKETESDLVLRTQLITFLQDLERRPENKAILAKFYSNRKIYPENIKILGESYPNPLKYPYPERAIEFDPLKYARLILRDIESGLIYKLIETIESKGYELEDEDEERIFNHAINNLEYIESEEYLENLTKTLNLIKVKRIQPSNRAFKTKKIESSPNHSTCIDILTLLIKPQEFTHKDDFVEITQNHKNKNVTAYTKLTIPKPEQIEIGDATFTVLKCFDWKDRKILRLIFTEALHHIGEFPVSLIWVLKQIGDYSTGGKSLTEKLEDLRKRFKKYRAVSIQWRYKSGKKIETGNISGGDLFIIQTSDFFERKTKNSFDIELDVKLGDWFETNKNLIKEFTKIPQKLLTINTHRHWRAYAIGEKICILLRINKEKILKQKSTYRVPIKLSIKTLLDEIITPLELKQCLEDSRKGYEFKDSFLKEISYLENELNWQFQWIGLTDNQSFNDFYNAVSFICHVDPELESEILGEKNVKPIKRKSKVPLTIKGDLVKKLRKHLKMTQTVFGKSIGYTRTLISKIERGSESASEQFINSLYLKYTEEIKLIQK